MESGRGEHVAHALLDIRCGPTGGCRGGRSPDGRAFRDAIEAQMTPNFLHDVGLSGEVEAPGGDVDLDRILALRL